MALVAGGESELSELLREDGRLLRMFVQRGEHRRPEARDRATTEWLIRGNFYDKWLDTFVGRYAPPPDVLPIQDIGELSDEERSQIVEAFEKALGTKVDVAQLREAIDKTEEDVFVIRDTLLAAVNEMLAPRRMPEKLGTGRPMDEYALEQLRQMRQVKLRDIVHRCLSAIYEKGIGGEVLRVALECVTKLISKFESKDDEVMTAWAGKQWNELKSLAEKIKGSSAASEVEDGPKHVAHDGKGTKQLLERVIRELGGQGTTDQILGWIVANPTIVEETSSRLNHHIRANTPGRKQKPIWQVTCSNVLSKCFRCSKSKQDGKFVWRSLQVDEVGDASGEHPLPVQDAVVESVVDSVVEFSAVTSEKKKRAKKRKSDVIDAIADVERINEAYP